MWCNYIMHRAFRMSASAATRSTIKFKCQGEGDAKLERKRSLTSPAAILERAASRDILYEHAVHCSLYLHMLNNERILTRINTRSGHSLAIKI